ncbi:tetraspanin family protein [Nocardia altamirensis]|uniref:tetraspanin family protein n=1 Tax=Nocardia altamirensis TaxID=472158 RepID=UPI00083FF248|nr:tetraspanin family protein [Nocardia altamirensis]
MDPFIIIGVAVLVIGLLGVVSAVRRRPNAMDNQLTVAAVRARLAEEQRTPLAEEAQERLVAPQRETAGAQSGDS